MTKKVAAKEIRINANTIIGIVITVITLAGSTFIGHRVNTIMDRQEINAKVIEDVPNKISEIKLAAETNQKITGMQIDAVAKDVKNLQTDVQEGKTDLKSVKEAQSKLITRDELNGKINLLEEVKAIKDKK